MYLKKALERIKKLKWQFLQGRKEHAGCWEGFFPDFSMNYLVALSNEIDRLRKLNSARFKEYNEYRKQFTATADLIKQMKDELELASKGDEFWFEDSIDKADAWLKEHK